MNLILPYFKKNIDKILLGVVCMILVDGAQILIPQIIKKAVDTLAQSRMDPSALMAQSAVIFALAIAMALLRYVWRVLLMGSARDVETGLRGQLFSHILNLSPRFFDQTRTGDIMSHATSDINHVRMAFGFGIIVLVDTLLMGGATLGIMILTHPKLTLLSMLPMPFLIYFTKILGRKMHDFHKTAQESLSMLTEMVRESFFGIRVIKVFNFEPAADKKLALAAGDYFTRNLKRAVVTALLKPLMIFFFNLSTLVIIGYGGVLVMEQQLTPGELVAFLQYMGLLAWPAIAIGWMINLYQRGMASLKRIGTLLEARPEIMGSDDPARRAGLKGDMVFENACFEYTAAVPVLSDISLAVKPGMPVGITGPPGSGKTSLVQLIAGLYPLTKGRLLIDGRDIGEFQPNDLRRQINFMSQEPFLFSGTLKENILMGRDIKGPDLDRIINICDLARTIDRMPDKLDTVVGERGVTLSGGQKQRLALARTLAAPAPVTILDDPVSQLDIDTAQKVMAGITAEFKKMSPCPSLIIISHRLSALAECERIFILDNGRITDQGRHEDLIRTSRYYRKTFNIQQFEKEAAAHE